MDKRFILFLFLALAVMLGNALVMSYLQGPPPQEVPVAVDRPDRPAQPKPERKPPPTTQERVAPRVAATERAPRQKQSSRWVTLGSADPASPYRMLALLTTRGAAVDQIELNGFLDQDDEGKYRGYLGPLAEANMAGGKGVLVRAIGPGTPAAAAGVQVGDVITGLNKTAIREAAELRDALALLKPGERVQLKVKRQQRTVMLTPTLGHRPLKVVGQEASDPRSLLMTLEQIDDDKIPKQSAELEGLAMRSGDWQLLSHDPSHAEFTWDLPERGLQVIKRYRLTKNPSAADVKAQQPLSPNYHLTFEVEIRNTGDEDRQVAYRLDGPTGLPTEGWWYASKISRNWGGIGVRDVVTGFLSNGDFNPAVISCTDIAEGDFDTGRRDAPLIYMGVDAQYFAAVLIPLKERAEDPWFDDAQPRAAGPVPADKHRRKLTNTSFRLTSRVHKLPPDGPPLKQSYLLFAGPKKPNEVLAKYNLPQYPVHLDELVYYGWFGWVSRILLNVLHFFYSIVGNYGIAIIMLTVLVRSCMFPLSRKQALGAQKMQELQPEIKKLNEKYKGSPEQRTRATQDLFRKHNYNPLGGCLLMFLQLPIFIGLYRALMVDVELRQSPLIAGLYWCSDLAAPDMLFRWHDYLPDFIAGYTGWLGPYFNVLPVITVGLFLWQQKMFMPPPADEQAAMQYKIMQYMMVFMAVMFFKVASGLCIYFIASSLWGIAERKLLPKAKPPAPGTMAELKPKPVAVRDGTNGNGAKPDARKKQRGKK